MGKDIQNFFSPEEKKRIVDAIKAAEKETSGEIRLHLANRCKGNVLDCAAFIFEKLDAQNGLAQWCTLFPGG
jgi:uncharacterized membrane protein